MEPVSRASTMEVYSSATGTFVRLNNEPEVSGQNREGNTSFKSNQTEIYDMGLKRF